MPLLAALSSDKSRLPAFDPTPETVLGMPVRPYLVLHIDLRFFSDPACKVEVEDARLIMIRSEDPRQQHHPVELMPTRKRYQKGQILRWEINSKRQWEDAWFKSPETGNIEKAWVRSVEFTGKVVKV